MPQIGWFEILIIVSISIIVIGPKDFPYVLKKIGSWVSSTKKYVNNFQKQISDLDSLEEIVTKVLSKNTEEVQDYKAGKHKLLGFFVGQVMKETHGKANPKSLQEILKKQLSK